MTQRPAEHAQDDFWVRFWGVRGSISTSDQETLKYGGNTSCLEVGCGRRRLIFDGGTGIRYLGKQIMQTGEPVDTDLLLTHTHYDHICGIPFFVPFFVPGNRIRIHAGHLLPQLTIRKVLTELMMAPLFPVPPEIFAAQVRFIDFHAGETLDLGDGIVLRTTALNHPNNATGYRIEYGGRSICYVTDNEHVAGQRDDAVIGLCRDSEIMIYDSMFTEHEYSGKVGWGHSTWQEALHVADQAGVGTCVLFHHDPDHTDAFMDEIAGKAAARRPGTVVAREGLLLRP